MLRLFFCFGVVIAGFAVFISRSSAQHRDMWLLVPVFGAVPAILAAALLFVPIERFAYSRGLDHWATFGVVIAGGSIVFLFTLIAHLPERLRRTSKPAPTPFRFGRFVSTASIWIISGALWGALWRASAFILMEF